VKIVRREIDEIVHYLPDQKNNKISVDCVDRAQGLPWPAPNIWLTIFQISSKSVYFRQSYSRPREGRSLGPQGKSNTRPKRYIANNYHIIVLPVNIQF